MGVRRGPIHISETRPMLDAAKVFDAKNAVNRMRAEGLDALRLLDEHVSFATVHKLRLAITMIDDVRADLRGESK